MRESRSYEFDPCSIDGSDEVSIDDWKPTSKEHKIQKSKWRQEQYGAEDIVTPSRDDVAKIKSHLKKGYLDTDIMQTFRIPAEILVAIKEGRYCPVDGVFFDTPTKVFNEFENLQKELKILKYAIMTLARTKRKDVYANIKKNLGYNGIPVEIQRKNKLKAPKEIKPKVTATGKRGRKKKHETIAGTAGTDTTVQLD